MGVMHKKNSLRDLRLTAMGITPPDDWNDVEQVRVVRRLEMGVVCTETIYAGIEIDGKRYSLTAYDQTEIMAQITAVREGAEFVPYHADGELCRMFSAVEFMVVAEAAIAHIFFHRTYCNHLNAWIRRADMAELYDITYGIELPSDLSKSMLKLLKKAGGGL